MISRLASAVIFAVMVTATLGQAAIVRAGQRRSGGPDRQRRKAIAAANASAAIRPIPIGEPCTISQPMPQMWSVGKGATTPASRVGEGGANAPEALAMAGP